MSAIATRVKAMREQRGLLQHEVAEKMGISRPTYIAVESGKKQLTIDEAVKLADVLKTSVDELVFGTPSSLIQDSDEHDVEKYSQVLLTCLEFGADKDGKITKTKLAKLIYLVDFAWFYIKRYPMTGMQYRRIQQGPVPNIFFRIVDELFETGAITIEPRGSAMMIRANDVEAPKSRLNSEEIKLIETVSERWKNKNTKDIVDFTHSQKPWLSKKQGESIPYESILEEPQEHLF